jgi:hypothetical protein
MTTNEQRSATRARPPQRGTGTLAGLLCALASAGCSILGGHEPTVSFATEPPGARVLVDKRDSGFVTPCRLSLPSGGRHRVEIVMPGYAPVLLRVERGPQAEVILWRDMYVRPVVWRFPLWLNLEDALQPVKIRRTYSPGHVFVRLERAQEP